MPKKKLPKRWCVGVGEFHPTATDAEGQIRNILLLDNDGTTVVEMRKQAATHGMGLNFLVLCVLGVCWDGGGGHADCLRVVVMS